MLPGTVVLRCGRVWRSDASSVAAEADELAMAWRAYLLEDDEEEQRVLMFCPLCGRARVRPVSWDDRGEPPPSAMG